MIIFLRFIVIHSVRMNERMHNAKSVKAKSVTAKSVMRAVKNRYDTAKKMKKRN